MSENPDLNRDYWAWRAKVDLTLTHISQALSQFKDDFRQAHTENLLRIREGANQLEKAFERELDAFKVAAKDDRDAARELWHELEERQRQNTARLMRIYGVIAIVPTLVVLALFLLGKK